MFNHNQNLKNEIFCVPIVSGFGKKWSDDIILKNHKFISITKHLQAHCDEDFVPKTRAEMTASMEACLSKMEMTTATFTDLVEDKGDADVLKTVTKCMVRDMGFLDEGEDGTGVFNKERLMKQFGVEESRATVDKCVDENPIDKTNIDKSVYTVMHCLETSNLKMYRD